MQKAAMTLLQLTRALCEVDLPPTDKILSLSS